MPGPARTSMLNLAAKPPLLWHRSQPDRHLAERPIHLLPFNGDVPKNAL